MIKLAIAEDHNALIDGVKLFLEYEDDIQFVGFANNGKALCELVDKKQPNVVVTDIRMPVMNGIEATKKILKKNPNIKIIAFTMFDQDKAVNQMIEAGAKGYILKNSNLKELLYAIRQVYNGHIYYDSNINTEKASIKTKTKGILTKRQIEILKLIAEGKTNQEIADTLFIGKSTVETHRKNMVQKLKLKGTGGLLRYAMESKYKF
ncbi:response regulator transcription factor [Seonamhaeicola sediminis]|uniref:Response regulator transcription factor n=1 Tax=Seonamhaeicola sediminis TaxID=2528206 RepID=A0A562YCI1_9FLAO|nr:response regulator transcription factor [Seonamhaeicola sediminis]TWO31753.1 response regulator transcription factor [Seonamhaeicola sediminis]